MNDLRQQIHGRALEIRRENQTMDLATIENLMLEGAAMVIQQTTDTIQRARLEMEQHRQRAGAPQ